MEIKNVQKQKGFTLVEIAIVLVIIGLLLGGVLKGQELIENTKIKTVKADSEGIISAMYGYQDRFRTLPGDDARATINLAGSDGIADIVDGNGNGVIESANGETGQVFAQLRAAGFMSGSGVSNPISAFGGVITVVTSPKGTQICQSGLNNQQMAAVDIRFDDGATNTNAIGGGTGPDTTGSITYTQATAAVAETAAGAGDAVDGEPGVLCIQY